MGVETGIEWADHTFNPWIGCTPVSGACDNCYAETLVHRYGWAEWGVGKPRHRTSASNWGQPLKWDRAAAKAGVRRRVFCASLADVFDAEVPDDWRDDLMPMIEATPNLDWMLLTKRPQVAKRYFANRPVPDNVWLGTTVENQKMANLRIPILLSIPAKTRFLSCEPLLGPVVLSQDWYVWNDRINWIIVGGESGTAARPMHLNWAQHLRDICLLSGISFFFKQWGEWAPASPQFVPDGISIAGEKHIGVLSDGQTAWMSRVGKKSAGSLLDGKAWKQFPDSRQGATSSILG